jgi:WD40 repeat protein
MVGLILVRRLVVGFCLVVLDVAFVTSANAREPVVLRVADDTEVWSIAFSPKGDVLAALRSGELILWKTQADSAGERLIKRIAIPGGRDRIWGAESPLAFSHDGALVALAAAEMPARGFGNAIQVWDIKAEKVIATLKSLGERQWPFAHFAFLPKSHDLVVALDSSIEVWSPATGARRTIAAGDSFEGVAIQHSRFLGDGSFVTARADGRVCLWDLENAKLKTFRKVNTTMYYVGEGGGGGGLRQRNLIVTSPDAKRAVVIDNVKRNDPAARYLSLWDLEKGKMLRKLTDKGTTYLPAVDWSADGKFLSWISSTKKRRELVVWDVGANKERTRIAIPTDLAIGDGISISPDSRLIASIGFTTKKSALGPLSDAGLVLLWDISDLTKDEESQAESKKKDAAK